MFPYPKTPRLKTTSLDDAWRKLPVVVSEKLDGANAGVFFEGAALRVQSRRFVDPTDPLFAGLRALCGSIERPLYRALGERYALFGEWLYGKHRIWYDALPGYLAVYDLFDREDGGFLATDARRALLADVPLPEAPILFRHPQLRKVHNFSQFIAPPAWRSPRWRAGLIAQAQALGFDPQAVLQATDDAPLAEGVYIKIEDGDRVVGRLKLHRDGFMKTRLASGRVFPNRLA